MLDLSVQELRVVCVLVEEGFASAPSDELAARLGLRLLLAHEPLAVMRLLDEQAVELLLMPLGVHEEEVVLLLRALRKRAARRPPVVLAARGGSLIENLAEAQDSGAEYWLPALPFDETLAGAVQWFEQRLRASAVEARDELPAPVEVQALSLGSRRRRLPELSYLACISKLEQIRYGDCYEALGVEVDTPQPQLRMAYLRMLQVFGGVEASLGSEQADELLSGLDDAYLTLCAWRDAYTVALLRDRG